MTEARINFINWHPDLEDTENKGLTVAENVVHEPEGYKPIHLASAGAFSTTGGLGASNATVTSLIAKPVGAANDLFCAWMANNTLHVGINGVTATTSATGYPLSFATAGAGGGAQITAFDVSEYAGKISFVVEAAQNESIPSTSGTIRHSGVMDF